MLYFFVNYTSLLHQLVKSWDPQFLLFEPGRQQIVRRGRSPFRIDTVSLYNSHVAKILYSSMQSRLSRSCSRPAEFDYSTELRYTENGFINIILWRNNPLLSNGSEITFPLQRIATNESLLGNKSLNKGIPVMMERQLTVRHGDLYSDRLEVIKESWFIRRRWMT
jgi:hypothetical protein